MVSKIIWCVFSLLLLQIMMQNRGLQKLFRKRGSLRDSLLDFTELAAEHGYKSEKHAVVTEDGYILTLFRIPKGKNCHWSIQQPPVLIIHGLLLTSDSWLDSGPEAGLAYLISDDCYDLWLGNVRGNYYSREHIKLKPDEDPKFWQFSTHEIGFYDLPAMIDYILEYTKSKELNYIGYSQGGTSLLIMCSERSGYYDRVRIAILLHPASKLKHTQSKLFRLITKIYQLLEPYLQNAFDVLPLGGIVQKITSYFCQNHYIADKVCRTIISLIDSYHADSIAVSTIRAMSEHFPAGTSVKSMTWYSQLLNLDELQKFDYGSTTNLKIYGTVEPPLYNINATNIPLVIIHGKNDYLVSSKDIEWLRYRLPNVLELFYVQDPLWNHLDVPYSQHSRRLILPKILEYLFKYSDEKFELTQFYTQQICTAK